MSAFVRCCEYELILLVLIMVIYDALYHVVASFWKVGYIYKLQNEYQFSKSKTNYIKEKHITGWERQNVNI